MKNLKVAVLVVASLILATAGYPVAAAISTGSEPLTPTGSADLSDYLPPEV